MKVIDQFDDMVNGGTYEIEFVEVTKGEQEGCVAIRLPHTVACHPLFFDPENLTKFIERLQIMEDAIS